MKLSPVFLIIFAPKFLPIAAIVLELTVAYTKGLKGLSAIVIGGIVGLDIFFFISFLVLR